MSGRISAFVDDEAREKYLTVYDRAFADWPAERELRIVEDRFGQTAVHVVGPETPALPLVLLHAFSCTAAMWAPNVAAWARDRRVYAVDSILDVGRSVQQVSVRSAEELADWVAETLGLLGLARAHLAGASAGGFAALATAVYRPEVVASVVGLDPAGVIAGTRPRYALDFATHRFSRSSERRWSYLSRNLSPEMMDLLDASSLFRPYGMVLPRKFASEDVARITAPLLMILGSDSNVVSVPAVVERLAEVLPEARVAVVKSGHLVSIDAVEVVNGLVSRFIAKVDGGAVG